MTYLRFVASVDSEEARNQNGLFTELQILKDKNQLFDYQIGFLEDTFIYFNDNLPVPPYSRKNIPKEAVAWFKDTAQEFINKMWDLVTILEENDVNTRVLKTDKPDMILYEDEFQVVAKSKKF
ncbi:hypothetical protein QBK95_16455 [Aquimarina sp. 2201CG14-23]|nr:hypothetical protein [Aquimarina sp. 2201CG14-23]